MMSAFHSGSLSFRLTLLYAAAFSLFLAVAFGCALLLVKTSMHNEINDDLSDDIVQYRKIYNRGGIGQVIDEIKRDIKPAEAGDEFVRIIDAQGRYIFLSDTGGGNGPEINKAIIADIAGETSGDGIYFETQEIPEREFATRIAYSLIGPGVIIQIGESLEQTAEMMALLVYLFLVSFLIVIPAAFIFGWFITRRAVRGIEKVSNAATAIRNGDLDSQVDVSDQSREIRNLGDTFNSMARRIRELITEMREMIDNIAHDLRTPLGRIRMISEMTLSTVDNEACKAAAANTLEQCDKVLQYINAILDVAEAEAGISTGQDEPVDISAITNDA
ncbi:MAG: HAMP domain-containing protein, partial [Gammaproteobacteria bacterium]